MRRLASLLCCSLLSWVVVGACSKAGGGDKRGAKGSEAAEKPRDAYSNTQPEDYVGPGACADCHAERYQQWSGNLHRKMNRLVSEEGAVVAPFAGELLEMGGEERVRFDREGGVPRMTFLRGESVVREYRVTRTIGSRYLQEYVGVQTRGPEPEGEAIYQRELRLPYGYLLRAGAWFHQQYFDSWHDEEFDVSGVRRSDVLSTDDSPWRGRCAWCHNSYPFSLRMARLRGDQSIGSGIELLYQERERVERATDATLLPTDELVTVGISCESCHFGGRAHVEEGKPMRFAPQSPGLVPHPDAPVLAGTREDARSINSICAQCHSVPTPLYPNGAGSRNSSEALDLLSGACSSQIKCTDCHDPHVPGPGADAPVQPAQLGACLSCHGALADPAVAAEHSRHGPEVSCMDCHMPKMVQGLSSFIRSHRISSPTDERMLELAPNACNLCHLDRSVAWTVRELREEWNLDIRRDGSEELAWRQWLGGEDRATRLAAIGAIGRQRLHEAMPALLERLRDPVAHDRLRALFAVEEILRRKLRPSELELGAAPALRDRQVDDLIDKWEKNTLFDPAL